jgi:hypothetical protein
VKWGMQREKSEFSREKNATHVRESRRVRVHSRNKKEIIST